jgi:1-acyl-sn-glycerol-3-phosphate acyltransferase
MRVVHAILSWLTTIVFLPTFGAVMVLFDVAQRVAYYVFGRARRSTSRARCSGCSCGRFAICGTHLAVERDPAVRSWTPYIVVSNHQSMFDIVILGSLLFSNFPKYISKRELGRWIPTVSFNLRAGGHVLIDRGDAPQALAAIRELGGASAPAVARR